MPARNRFRRILHRSRVIAAGMSELAKGASFLQVEPGKWRRAGMVYDEDRCAARSSARKTPAARRRCAWRQRAGRGRARVRAGGGERPRSGQRDARPGLAGSTAWRAPGTTSSRTFRGSDRREPRRCWPRSNSGRRTLTRANRQRVQVTSPRAVAELLLPLYGNRPVEQFGVVLLDTKHRVMRTTVVTIGTLDASIVHPREVFREAAAAGAAAIVVFHNHPSGDPEPSDEDIALTHRLIAAGVLMGIDVHRPRDSRQRALLQHEGREIHLSTCPGLLTSTASPAPRATCSSARCSIWACRSTACARRSAAWPSSTAPVSAERVLRAGRVGDEVPRRGDRRSCRGGGRRSPPQSRRVAISITTVMTPRP